MTMRWGPRRSADGTEFRLWAPDLDGVRLEVEGRPPIPMTPCGEGWFEARFPVGPGARYRFRLADDLAVPDPASRCQSGGVHGWSVVVDPDGHSWQSHAWTGRPWPEAVILEVHTGVLGGFRGVGERLDEWRDLGVTAIELMPVAAAGGTRNWGYDGVLPYAVAESYGSPDDLKALVDRAHQLGLMVLLDVVYNHFGPDGNYLGSYAAPFFNSEARNPWGIPPAMVRPPVRRFFIENALMWLSEYRFDGLRLDAVHAIDDPEFLDEMARDLRAACPDRHVHLILENEHNDPDRLIAGGYDAQWNDDFHNVLHVLLTGETEGYYAAFADDPTAKLARCLGEGFVFQGETMLTRARGKPSAHLPATAFVSFLQNHDQIGNRAMGERLTLLTSPDKLRAATALLLLCPQIPLIFMGDEVASTSPFLFFTDFQDELAAAVREGRRREFAHFRAFADPQARERIPDPNDPSTFETSKPTAGAEAEDWRWFYRRLLAIRRDFIVPRLEGATSTGATVIGEGAVTAGWRMADGSRLVMAVNLGGEHVPFPGDAGDGLFQLGTPGAPSSFGCWLT